MQFLQIHWVPCTSSGNCSINCLGTSTVHTPTAISLFYLTLIALLTNWTNIHYIILFHLNQILAHHVRMLLKRQPLQSSPVAHTGQQAGQYAYAAQHEIPLFRD